VQLSGAFKGHAGEDLRSKYKKKPWIEIQG